MSADLDPANRHRTLWRLAVAVWMVVIFALSSIPDPGIPSGFTTPGHAGLYFILGALAFLALRGGPPPIRTVALAIILASLYGFTDEVHQAFVPGRMPDPLDWAWDTVGAAVGAVLLAWIRLPVLQRLGRDDAG